MSVVIAMLLSALGAAMAVEHAGNGDFHSAGIAVGFFVFGGLATIVLMLASDPDKDSS